MKIVIQKNNLLNLLKMANQIVDNTNINPLLTNILIEAQIEANQIVCTFTNESISVKYVINENIEVKKHGSILVRSKILEGIVSKLQNESISLEKIDSSLNVSNSTFNANINLLDDNLYLDIDFNLQEHISFELESETIYDIEKKLFHCLLPKSEKVSPINGIYFDNENEEGIVNFVTTDSYKVALLKKEFVCKPFKIIVDPEVIKFINQFAERNIKIHFEFLDNKLLIKWKNVVLMSKLLIGVYPNVYNVFNVDDVSTFKINAKSLYNVIDHGIFLVNSEKGSAINIAVDNQFLEARFKSAEIGNSSEKITIDSFQGNEDIKFLVNAKYMLSILRAFEEHEVKVFFSSPNKPIIIADRVDNSFIQLVLPMRSF